MRCTFDQIVEIDQALARLGLLPQLRIGASGLELRGKEGGKVEQGGAVADSLHASSYRFLLLAERWVVLLSAFEDAWVAILLQCRLEKPVERLQALSGASGQPYRGIVADQIGSLGFPSSDSLQQAAHIIDRKHFVRTRLGHPALVCIERDAEHPPHRVAQISLPARLQPQPRVTRTAHQPAEDCVRSFQPAQLGNRFAHVRAGSG